MKKVIRYSSFEDLKHDVKSEDTSKSKDRRLQMEDFLKVLRRKWLEEKELQKKNLKTSDQHE